MSPVHIHLACTATHPEPPADLFDADDLSRAARFVHEKDRATWLRGRAFVRTTLAAALSVSPGTLRFKTLSGKKPTLRRPHAIEFNISHSGDWIALVLGTVPHLGVDVEVHAPDFPALDTAREFFPGQEYDWLLNQPVAQRHASFFHLWTAKEALMKATGLGFALEPGQISLGLGTDAPLSYVSHPVWALHRPAVPAGLSLAVCTPAKERAEIQTHFSA